MAKEVVFDQLVPGLTIRHANGTSYKIVKVVHKKGSHRPKVFARWRNGHIGRFGKEVVRLTAKHVLGFLRYRARQHPAKPLFGKDD